MQSSAPTSPGGAATQMAGVTTVTLVLIGVGIVLALLVIWWGAKKKAERRAAERELVDKGAVHGSDAAIDAAPDGTSETPTPTPTPPETPIAVASPLPVAPVPPPLAGDATPVVAAAPLDSNPAALAADLASPPAAVPAEADDLTRIKGLGPKLVARLGELGITRFDQIAALSPAEAEALDAQLGTFRGRLQRDRWIEQADYLARGDRAGFEAAFGRL